MKFLPDIMAHDLIKLQHVRKRVQFILWLEKTSQAAITALIVLGLYILTGLLGWPQKLPDMARAILLLLLTGICAVLFYMRLRMQTAPTEKQINTRIESASRLKHQPLETLHDAPAAGMSDLLWQAHIERTKKNISTLRAGWPQWRTNASHAHPSLILLAAIAIAALINGAALPQMMRSMFWPGIDTPYMPLPTLQSWITPPDYTHQAPLFIESASTTFTTSQNAVMTLTISGSTTQPLLHFANEALKNIEVTHMGQKSWQIKAELIHSTPIHIYARGRKLASWQAHIITYPLPSISWLKPPAIDKANARIKLAYKARQAYGIQHVKIIFTPVTHHSYDTRTDIERRLPLDGTPKEITTISELDMTEDLWAGDNVKAQLFITDINGHTAHSEEKKLRLPVRHFHNPLANSLQHVRKDFYTHKKNRREVANDLEAFMHLPGRTLEDPEIILNFASLVEFLKHSSLSEQDIHTETYDRLWQLALDLESGRNTDHENLLASQELEAARKAVAQQLEKMNQMGKAGQSEEEKAELEKRLARLRTAIQNKMAALFHQAQREHGNIPPIINMDMIGKGMLSDQLQQLQNLAENGKTAEALKHLQDMTDSTKTMRNATPQDLMNLGAQMAMQQQLQEQQALLKDLIARQTSLLDATQLRKNRRSAYIPSSPEQMNNDQAMATLPPQELLKHFQNIPPPTPLHEEEAHKADPTLTERKNDRLVQHALARALTELQQEYKDIGGKPPEGFKKAHTAMKTAQTALAKNDDAQTFTAQTEALKNLQQGQQNMQQAMQERQNSATTSILLPLMSSSQGSGKGTGSKPQPNVQSEGQQEDEDPLGRKLGKGKATTRDSSETNLSDTISPNQSRAIQEELRKRDSDRTRPQQELNYLDRLLKSFE